MKIKLLILGLIVGGFLYNGSGFAQTTEDSEPMIQRVHKVKKDKKAHKKTKKKVAKKHAKKKKKAVKKKS
jgi:hypothetical protein